MLGPLAGHCLVMPTATLPVPQYVHQLSQKLAQLLAEASPSLPTQSAQGLTGATSAAPPVESDAAVATAADVVTALRRLQIGGRGQSAGKIDCTKS